MSRAPHRQELPDAQPDRLKPELQTSDLTDAGKVMGTPQYMSPEQITAPGEVDHRADIYALGVVFYQMLTGELPGKHIEAPSKKVQIDVRLDEVVLRALEKKPERRYQQASVLKTQVETIAETPAEGTGQPATGEAPRISLMAVAGALCVAVAMAAMLLAYGIHKKTKAAAPEISRLINDATGDQAANSAVIQSWSGFIHLNRYLVFPLIYAGIAGATILGWLAVRQIRRVGGKIYGLGLAVFDGLFFPLLALDFLIVMVLGNCISRTQTSESVAILFAGTAAGLALVDLFIVRLIWRALTPEAKRSRGWVPAIMVAFIVVLALGFIGLFSVQKRGQTGNGGGVSLADRPDKLQALPTATVLDVGLATPRSAWPWIELENRARDGRLHAGWKRTQFSG